MCVPSLHQGLLRRPEVNPLPQHTYGHIGSGDPVHLTAQEVHCDNAVVPPLVLVEELERIECGTAVLQGPSSMCGLQGEEVHPLCIRLHQPPMVAKGFVPVVYLRWLDRVFGCSFQDVMVFGVCFIDYLFFY